MVQHTGGRKLGDLVSRKTAINHLIQNCYFNVGNVTVKLTIGVPMEIDPAPFWSNFFLYYYEEQYMSL